MAPEPVTPEDVVPQSWLCRKPSCSSWRLDADPLCPSGFAQAIVIGEEHAKFWTNRLGCRQMDRIQRAQSDGCEVSCTVEERFVDSDEVNSPEEPTGLTYEMLVAGPPEASNRLCPQQGC